jgi:hypothetical protein
MEGGAGEEILSSCPARYEGMAAIGQPAANGCSARPALSYSAISAAVGGWNLLLHSDLTGSFCTKRNVRNRLGREFCHGEEEV